MVTDICLFTQIEIKIDLIFVFVIKLIILKLIKKIVSKINLTTKFVASIMKYYVTTR